METLPNKMNKVFNSWIKEKSVKLEFRIIKEEVKSNYLKNEYDAIYSMNIKVNSNSSIVIDEQDKITYTNDTGKHQISYLMFVDCDGNEYNPTTETLRSIGVDAEIILN